MENKLQELKTEKELLIEKADKLHEQLVIINKKITQINEEISSVKFGFEPSLEKICAIENWNMVTGKEYNKISNYLRDNHSYIYQYGYNVDTGQVTFSINNYTKTNEHVEEFEYLLSLLRPDKDGETSIHIIDSNLSEFGAYAIINGMKIIKYYYRRRIDIKEFSSVKECLDYCYENLINIKEEEDDYDY